MSHFGLVCITHSDEVRYRTITRKRLLQHSFSEQQALLRELYQSNLERLEAAFAYCRREALFLYRLPSGLFPFSDEQIGLDVLAEFDAELARIGSAARRDGIRLVMHPDQFVVLSSDSDAVVENSIKILRMHALILDLLQQPRSPWAVIEIHGGKADRAERLVGQLRELPEGIRSRLALENDEYAYSAEEILAVCRAGGVPMVFDAHHHVVHEGLLTYEHPSVLEMLLQARSTWPDPALQLVHISNGRESFSDRNHSDLIDDLPSAYAHAPWIEVEAKMKERAIQELRAREQ